MIRIGFLVFPNMQQLDFTAPYEVFATWRNAHIHLVWKSEEEIVSSTGLSFRPTNTFQECPQLDVICMPGGVGINSLLSDDAVLDFLRRQAGSAKFVTSVCTGALVLGAAGLLAGKRATTHWSCIDLLAEFGAIPVSDRVVQDGAVMTGGGITAGIDFALTLIGEIAGATAAQEVQLQLEYAPGPPFDAGTPASAPREVLEAVRATGASLRAERERLVEKAAKRLAHS